MHFCDLMWAVMAVVLLTACGADAKKRDRSCPWAQVSSEQESAAVQLGLPVAFENDIGMRFALIPAGTFTMGSPKNELGHESQETLHQVTLTRVFYMQVTEVTNRQYRLSVAAHRSGRYGKWSLDEDVQPAAGVCWDDATEFAAWLSARDVRYTYHLPTEAEWEYACRAGSHARFSFGRSEGAVHRFANCSEGVDLRLASVGDVHDGHVVAAPVASFRPNAWGLYDMHGNVLEWCLDWYAPYRVSGTLVDPAGPRKPGRTHMRMLRGGWWESSFTDIRSACRRTTSPGTRYFSIGFRLVARAAKVSGTPR